MKDGGPAFPQQKGQWSDLDYSDGKHLYKGAEYEAKGGMSLRDWFAGMALSSMNIVTGGEIDAIAIDAYHIADAMIAESMTENGG